MNDNTAVKLSPPRSRARPFIKWVGGKGQLMEELHSRLPWKYKRYFEPFVGGGALLFSLQPEEAFIFDTSPELINTYRVIKNSVEQLIEELKPHIYDRDYYYKLRDIDRSEEFKSWSPVARAARFIYLNKTCFNGLYRVNSKGEFNVPFGRYNNPTILDADNLRACNEVLQKVEIHLNSFEEIEESLQDEDFVYFDPPYSPVSDTSNFTSYTATGFDLGMQRRLYDLCCRLDKRGIAFMLSNSAAPFVKELYSKFRVETVFAPRAVNSKADRRGMIPEVIVRNY